MKSGQKFATGILCVSMLGMGLLTACGSSSSTDSSSDSLLEAMKDYSATQATLDPEVAKSWPEKWCQAQPGISRSRLIEIMGAPTSDGNQGQSSSWEGFQYQFNAFYDASGNVRQLDINLSRLSATEKASLKCSETRAA